MVAELEMLEDKLGKPLARLQTNLRQCLHARVIHHPFATFELGIAKLRHS